jgi:hypothetical protein
MENPYSKHKTFAELGAELELFLAGGGSIMYHEDLTKNPPEKTSCQNIRINNQLCMAAIERYEELRKADSLMPPAPATEVDKPLFVIGEIAKYCKMAPKTNPQE